MTGRGAEGERLLVTGCLPIASDGGSDGKGEEIQREMREAREFAAKLKASIPSKLARALAENVLI